MIIDDSLDARGFMSGDNDDRDAAPANSDNPLSNTIHEQEHNQTVNDMDTNEPELVSSVHQQLDSSMAARGRIEQSGGSSNNNMLIVNNRPVIQSATTAAGDHAAARAITGENHNNHTETTLASSWPPHPNLYGSGMQAPSQENYANSVNAAPDLIELVESHHPSMAITDGNYIDQGFDLQHQHQHHADIYHHDRQNNEERLVNGDSITASSCNQQLFEPLVGNPPNDQQSYNLISVHHSSHNGHNYHHRHHHNHLNDMMQLGNSDYNDHSRPLGHELHHALVHDGARDDIYWSDAIIYDNYQHQHQQQHYYYLRDNHQQQEPQNHNHRANGNNSNISGNISHLCAQHQSYQAPSDEYNSDYSNHHHQSYHASQHSDHNHYHHHNHYATAIANGSNHHESSSCLPETVIALNEYDRTTDNGDNELVIPSNVISNSQSGNTDQQLQDAKTKSDSLGGGHWADVDEENNTHMLTLQPSSQTTCAASAPSIQRQHKTVIRRQGDNITFNDDDDNCRRDRFSSIADLDEQFKSSSTTTKSSSANNGFKASSNVIMNGNTMGKCARLTSECAASDRDDASSHAGSTSAGEERSSSTTTTCTLQAQTNVVRQCDWVIGFGSNHDIASHNISTKCNLSFNDLESFVAHLEEEHVKQDPVKRGHYFCRWSGCKRADSFNARYKLLVHMRVHSGEKPFECTKSPDCKKRFSRLENLKIHVRSHTGEKPYSCNYPNCTKSFTNSSDRIKHHKTHDNPKPYPCSEKGCNKRYTDPSSLRKHQKSHRRELMTGPSAIGLAAAGPTRIVNGSNDTNNNEFMMQDCRHQESIGYDYVTGIDYQQHSYQQQHQPHQQQPILPADYNPNCLLLQEQASPYHNHQQQQQRKQQQQDQIASSYSGRPSGYHAPSHNHQQPQQQQFMTDTITNYCSLDNNNYQTAQLDQLNRIDSRLSQTWAGPATSHPFASLQNNYTNSDNADHCANYNNNQASMSYESHKQDDYAAIDDGQHHVFQQQQFNESHHHPLYNQHSTYETQYKTKASSRNSNQSLLQMQHQQLMRSLPPSSSDTRRYASEQQHLEQHREQQHRR